MEKPHKTHEERNISLNSTIKAVKLLLHHGVTNVTTKNIFPSPPKKSL